jgi:hypothetical protein
VTWRNGVTSRYAGRYVAIGCPACCRPHDLASLVRSASAMPTASGVPGLARRVHW